MISKYVADTPEVARFDFIRGDTINDKTSKRINLVAEYLWNHGLGEHGTEELPTTFSDLTKNKKLQLVADHLENVINNLAKMQLTDSMQEVARTTAATEIEINY